MTEEEYIAVLLERQADWIAEHPEPRYPWLRPLLEWFVQDGDETTVTFPTAKPQPRVTTSHPEPSLAAMQRLLDNAHKQRAQLEAERDQLLKPVVADRAYSGHKPKTVRRNSRRMDRELARHTELTAQMHRVNTHIAALTRRIEQAEANQ
jgi:vancomycin resistance protein YoaR